MKYIISFSFFFLRYGSFGLLQTKESYRKRGYARSVIQDLSKHLESKMIIPYAYVLKTNVASLNLFLSLNFVVSHEDNWLIFNKE